MKLIKYTAPWCSSCKSFGMTLENVLRDFSGIEVVEHDISVTPAPGITTLPTIELNGKRAHSNLSAHVLRTWIKDAMK